MVGRNNVDDDDDTPSFRTTIAIYTMRERYKGTMQLVQLCIHLLVIVVDDVIVVAAVVAGLFVRLVRTSPSGCSRR
jgi:hypothetical protein